MATTAVIYARFSPRPNAADCESIELQVDRCEKYCESQGFTVVAWYEEPNTSGAATSRPQLEAAIKEACKSKGVLIAYSLSRFGRNVLTALQNIERLHQAGADFISVQEGLDTTKPMGKLIFTLIAAINEFERAEIRHRTQESMRFQQAQGRRMSCIPPYGWETDPEDEAILKKVPTEQVVIDKIVAWRNEQLSFRGIANRLNQGGYPNRNGKAWTHQLVQRILRRANKT